MIASRNRICAIGVSLLSFAVIGCGAKDGVQRTAADTSMTKRAAVSMPPTQKLDAEPVSKAKPTHAIVSQKPRSSSASFVGVGLPGSPRQAPADMTVKGPYTLKNGTEVRVEGVCKLSENSVSCWTALGKPNKTLEAGIRKALEGPEAPQRLSYQYGSKNRLVIARVTKKPRDSDDSGYIAVQAAGDNVVAAAVPTLPSEIGRSFSKLQAFWAAEPISATTTHLRLEESIQSGRPTLLDSRTGASCNLDGLTIRIVSISRDKAPTYFEAMREK